MSDQEELEAKKQQRLLEIPQVDSKLLAAHVVIYRTLGINKEFAVACMEELVRRRGLGDDFDYENYIELEIAKIPKIDETSSELARQIQNINSFRGVVKK